MVGYTIAEAAERAGIPATTLRYYEQRGVVPFPKRGANGYRRYDTRDIERLRFLGRARRLDLLPGDLADLARAWDTDSCTTVQHDLARLVARRLDEARRQVADLVALESDLQSVATQLTRPPREGPCNDDCACADVPAPATDAPQVTFRMADGAAAIACTLGSEATTERVEEWRALLGRAIARRPTPEGLILTFPMEPNTLSTLAMLAAAEQECCRFFDFRIHLAGTVAEFEVQAPAEAHEMVTALFGASGGAA